MSENDAFVIKQAERLYHVALVKENTKGGSGNGIFEVKKGTYAFILRVSVFTQKAKEHTEFELQWLEYLGERVDHVARPIRSVKDNLYEIITTEGKAYILSLFEKAPGRNPDGNNRGEFNESLFFTLGAVMGDLHRVTANYRGSVINPAFQWDNNAYSWRGDNEILDKDVCRCERKLLHKIHSLPITAGCYGIIHYDIHIDNFFVENNKIKLFDFYDCQFNWYAADMASAIFFMVQKGAGPLRKQSEQERTAFAQAYITSYLKGYLTTNTVSQFWVNKLDLFMKYQMTDEYRCAQNFCNEESMHLQPWYLKWHKDRIVQDLPYVLVDYNKIMKELPPLPER